jgi:hypothetical protein
VGVSLLSFTYFLDLKYHPTYFTLTWTLDYRYNSDLDDNTGHWQVLEHPEKGPDYSRVVYSTQVKLFNWIPDFVVNYLVNTALIESTTWVKRESEKVFQQHEKLIEQLPVNRLKNAVLTECFQRVNNNNKDSAAPQRVVYNAECANSIAERLLSESSSSHSINNNNQEL